MKKRKILFFILAIFIFSGCSGKEDVSEIVDVEVDPFLGQEFPVAEKIGSDGMESGGNLMEDCDNETKDLLERVELDYIGGGKHWRKGDYLGYRFIECDIEGTRARNIYVYDSEAESQFFFAYFRMENGGWAFDFSDIAIINRSAGDQRPTPKDALETMNSMYWFNGDNISP